MNVIHFCQFSAPYQGAFISLLVRLEELSNHKIKFFYVFPAKTKETPWIEEFKNRHDVHFTGDDLLKSTDEVLAILDEIKPDIVHTHFDGYDLPVVWARRRYLNNDTKPIKIVWHLHNAIKFHTNLFKKIYQFFIFKYHYGYLASEVNIISVSQEMESFVSRFRIRSNLNVLRQVMPYGMKVPRISDPDGSGPSEDYFVFGTFGGRNVQKRIDVLLEAAQVLERKEIKFKVVITKGVDTKEIVTEFYNGNLPYWLTLVDQTDNVEEFFNQIDCFVSTAVHETFSFAILEASFYEKPVIQSDIAGTSWNANNPSTFVFDSTNSKELSNKMLQVMSTPKDEMKKRCFETRQLNVANYDLDIWCKKIEDIYFNLKT